MTQKVAKKKTVKKPVKKKKVVKTAAKAPAPKIAVLIPCYNEQITVAKVVADFKQVLPDAEVYVYDNNSTDKTAELATAAGAIVRPSPKQGKGAVVRQMFKEVDADCYVIVDGDDTYPAEPAVAMIDKVLKSDVDMVIGDRLSSSYFTANKRPFHNFGNSLVRWLVNKVYKGDIKDVMTGYRAFSPDFVKSFPALYDGFEVETEMTLFALSKQYKIENYIIEYRDRPAGSSSKLRTVSDGIKVLRAFSNLTLIYKPIVGWAFPILFDIILAIIMFCTKANGAGIFVLIIAAMMLAYAITKDKEARSVYTPAKEPKSDANDSAK